MRAAGHGRILNLSSTGGVVAWPGWGVYSATKFAVEGITEALRAEVAPLGIQVTAVQPGPFRTDFLASTSLEIAEQTIDAYAASGGASRTRATDNNKIQESDPAKAAAAILTIADVADMPARIPLGSSTVADITAKIKNVTDEVAAWHQLSTSTDYSPA
ncbi:hypothetical protein Ahu01nite_093110 [Winogradskya humida]|uniref:Short subunit dehydrogenase n=2 Tax=Winogradskya humida TaxID=113566 RepID=A0ABQ4A5R9_9ACTN|nr:hypothetical protein Ahu01nite_093110 [Actinoplanes humidus]